MPHIVDIEYPVVKDYVSIIIIKYLAGQINPVNPKGQRDFWCRQWCISCVIWEKHDIEDLRLCVSSSMLLIVCLFFFMSQCNLCDFSSVRPGLESDFTESHPASLYARVCHDIVWRRGREVRGKSCYKPAWCTVEYSSWNRNWFTWDCQDDEHPSMSTFSDEPKVRFDSRKRNQFHN